MGLDYLPNPLSRLRRQLSQGESQAGLSAAVYLIEAGLDPPQTPPLLRWLLLAACFFDSLLFTIFLLLLKKIVLYL